MRHNCITSNKILPFLTYSSGQYDDQWFCCRTLHPEFNHLDCLKSGTDIEAIQSPVQHCAANILCSGVDTGLIGLLVLTDRLADATVVMELTC